VEATYRFGDLIEWARTLPEVMFLDRVPSPVLVATGTLAIKVLPGTGPKATGLIELPTGGSLEERLRNDPQLARLWEVRRADGQPGNVMVGRTTENDVAIDDSSMSRQHAALELAGEALLVRDLGSRNGTFVNDERIATDAPLRAIARDILRFGRVSLQYHTPLSLYGALIACLG